MALPGHVLWFIAAGFWFGVAFTIGVITTLAVKFSEGEGGEGALGLILGLAALALAVYSLVLALRP